MLLMSTVLCRPRVPFRVGVKNIGTRQFLVVTNSRSGPREVHVVHDPDDIDDVVEASARRFVDPHGVLDDDAVEAIIDPHDTLEDSIQRVADPQEWAEDQREDQFERLQATGHNSQALISKGHSSQTISNEDALEIAEDAAERQEEEREDMYEAMEEALERHLDPTGTKGIDVEFVQPNDRGNKNFAFGGVVHHPVPRPTLHHQVPQVVPRPVFVQPVTVPVTVPVSAVPKNTETSAPTSAATSSTEKQKDNQQETIKEFQGEVKDIAEDVVESAQTAKSNGSNGSTEKPSNGKKP